MDLVELLAAIHGEHEVRRPARQRGLVVVDPTPSISKKATQVLSLISKKVGRKLVATPVLPTASSRAYPNQTHLEHLGVEVLGLAGVGRDVGDVVEAPGAQVGHVRTLRVSDFSGSREWSGSSVVARSMVRAMAVCQSPSEGSGKRTGWSTPARR